MQEQVLSTVMIALALNAVVMILADGQMSCVRLLVTKSLPTRRAVRMLLKPRVMVFELLLRRIKDIAVPTNVVTASEMIAQLFIIIEEFSAENAIGVFFQVVLGQLGLRGDGDVAFRAVIVVTASLVVVF